MLFNSIIYFLLCFIGEIVGESIYKAHVINLANRTDRLETISKQLNNFGIPFQVFTAITPADIDAEILARKTNSPLTGLFHPETKLNFVSDSINELRRTLVGCLQSHVQVLLQISESKTDEPVLILEDDAYLLPDFYKRTVDLMKRLPSDWDIFHVGYCGWPKCDIKGPKSIDFCKIQQRILACTQAYFVNGSKAAELALNAVNTEVPKIIDFVLYKSSSNYYASLPMLAKQLYNFGSDNGNVIDHWRDTKDIKIV